MMSQARTLRRMLLHVCLMVGAGLTGWPLHAAGPGSGAATPAHQALPPPASLQAALGQAPVIIRVVEPHLSTRGRTTLVDYRGWPAAQVLDHWLGADWRKPGRELEFRALDGYVSRIPVEQFARYRAYLVFERVGHPSFSVDNELQNEKNIALGPYYLVWDNMHEPTLIAQGGSWWPYQIDTIRVSESRLAALLPGDMAATWADAATLAQTHCLNCHQVNGYGADKVPLNLAAQVKALDEASFRSWVLTPQQIKPGTTMPALPEGLTPAVREGIAQRLYGYFRALPLQP